MNWNNLRMFWWFILPWIHINTEHLPHACGIILEKVVFMFYGMVMFLWNICSSYKLLCPATVSGNGQMQQIRSTWSACVWGKKKHLHFCLYLSLPSRRRVLPPVPPSCPIPPSPLFPFLRCIPSQSHVLSEYTVEWVSPAGAFACHINYG